VEEPGATVARTKTVAHAARKWARAEPRARAEPEPRAALQPLERPSLGPPPQEDPQTPHQPRW